MAIQKLIEAIEKKKSLPEFSKLDAMQMLDVLGERLQSKQLLTVLLFWKSWNLKRKQSEALLDADDAFKYLQEQLNNLFVYNPTSSQKEPPLMISSLRMLLSPALSH